MRASFFALVAVLLSLLVPASAGATSPKPGGQVTISGKAYVFNHMDTFIPGATIRVRELPKLSTTTDANGDYSLKVPNDATITPYIDPPDGYNQIDLQTFQTRGQNIVNANFQTPADLEYNALAALLGVSFGPDGRPAQCVIVSTASARDVRGVPYQTFVDRTPHGVAGATATEFPEIAGPIYFNDSVIPDPSKTATSGDGGMIWTGVPDGAYRIATASPSTRFAGFLASCKAGRVINANPPWGAYELSPGEKPLASGVAVADVGKAKAGPARSGQRSIAIPVDTPERLTAEYFLKAKGGRVVASGKLRKARDLKISMPESITGRLVSTIKLTDSSGGVAKYKRSIRLKPIGK